MNPWREAGRKWANSAAPLPGAAPLAPDLDWMLSNDQVSDAALVEALTAEYGEAFSRLADSLLPVAASAIADAEVAARARNRIVQEALVTAVLQRHTFRMEQGSAKVWLYAKLLAAVQARSHLSLRFDAPASGQSASAGQEQIANLLYHEHAFQAAELAALLHLSEAEVLPLPAPAAPRARPAPAAALQPAAILKAVTAQRRRDRRSLSLRELGLSALAVLLTALGGWWFSAAFPEATPVAPEVTRLATRPAATSPATPTLPPWALSFASAEAEIRQRLAEATYGGWSTLWADGVVMDYGPLGYVGAARVYRNQVWLARTGQALILGGAPEGQPDYSRLILPEMVYEANLRLKTAAEYPDAAPAGLAGLKTLSFANLAGQELYGFYLYDLLFPAERYKSGRLEAVGLNETAGLATLATTWRPGTNRLPAEELWVDILSGTVLRRREFDPGAPNVTRREIILASIVYDPPIPAGFFQQARQMPQTVAWGETWQPVEAASVRLPYTSLPAPGHQPFAALAAAAADFDAAQSSLQFQWPNGLPVEQLAYTAATIIADGYALGEVLLGDPWTTLCRRAPNGRTLAFYAPPRPELQLVSGLRWLDLKAPLRLHDPLPNAMSPTTPFAFSPDSQALAFWGCGGSEANCGIYLHDLATGKNRKLVNQPEQPQQIGWSADGQFVFSAAVNLEVFTVQNGVLVKSAPFAPIQAGEARLPPELGPIAIELITPGLEGCSLPPPTRTP